MTEIEPNVEITENFLPENILYAARAIFLRDPLSEKTDLDEKNLDPLDHKNQFVEWMTDEESKVVIMGKKIKIPRIQTAYSVEPGITYKFTGTRINSKPESSLPILKTIREYIEEKTGLEFNFAFINYYANGQQYIGYHSDGEKELVPGSSIASMSFGQERDFYFRNIMDPKIIKQYVLHDNTFLLMNHPTNTQWKHCLPKRSLLTCPNPRVNITFRQFRTQK